MTNPSARIVRVASPEMSPGQCGVCGTSTDEQGFAYFGLDFEFYGNLYFCSSCSGETARLFGYQSPTELDSMRETLDAQNAELNTLRQAVLGLESAVDTLAGELSRRGSNPAALAIVEQRPNNGPSDPVDQPDEKPADADVDKPIVHDTNAGEGPTQSSNERRPNDLLSTSSADELLGL